MGQSDAGRLTIYVDGAARGNPGPAAIGVAIEDEKGNTAVSVSSYIGRATNNQAEYRALMVGLEEAARLKARHIDIKSDSELLVRQLQGSYKVRHDNLKPLFQQAKQLLTDFKSFTITHIPRNQNSAADALANEALDAHLHG